MVLAVRRAWCSNILVPAPKNGSSAQAETVGGNGAKTRKCAGLDALRRDGLVERALDLHRCLLAPEGLADLRRHLARALSRGAGGTFGKEERSQMGST